MKFTGRILKVEPFQVLFCAGSKKVWLPRQEIRNLADIRNRPENRNFPERIPVNVPVALSIPRWLAERKFGTSRKDPKKQIEAP